MKPEKPITRKEMYLDVATGGSTELPSPVTREEKYLAKIAGESVDIPTPVTRYEMLLAAVAGESYTLTPVTRLEIYLAKAAGQDVEIPQPVTREEMYWFDYCGGTPTPPEREYTGAVPVTFIADGTPLIDLLISGNEEHSGTPSPTSPVMPQGTGERTGNLFDGEYPNIDSTVRYRALNLGNGTYTLSSTVEIAQGSAGTLFLLAGNVSSGASTATNAVYKDRPITVTAIDGYVTIAYRVYTTDTPVGKETMLNEGSSPLPYEPYGYKIPISSAGQITPVYPGEVQTTRKIKKLVLTGDSTYDYRKNSADNSNYLYYTLMSDNSVGARICTCSHLPFSASGAPTNSVGCNARTQNVIYINFGADIMNAQTSGNTVAGLKEYLAAQYAAGTPVTIWYVLAEPETSIVNEPLMKIGDYADTLSMEQAGVSIPTANGSTTLDVETTVKPSEVYIKYRGEAAATLSALPAEVSSPEANEEVNPEETEEEENGSEDVSLQHEFEAIE